MTDFNERIERIAELEAKATPGEWSTDPEFEESLTAICISSEREEMLFGACDWPDADLICALRNEALPLLREMQAENERLKAREKKLKETLLPVCEYAAEIYNRGIPAGEMPPDTIQRLNSAFKMFGG